VLRLRIIKVSWFIALIAMCVNGYAHDTDGFYVVPVPTGEIVEREVCNGTPVGVVAFVVDTMPAFRVVSTGDVFSTTSGHLIQVTGNSEFVNGSDQPQSFRVAPSSLPNPTNGIKGPYYIISRGKLLYARFL